MQSKISNDKCLRGSVNDYIDSFESQMEKLERKLNAEKRHWSNQARSINLLKAKQESQLKQLLEQHQKEISNLLQAEAPPVVLLSIKALPLIGKPVKPKMINFKWPTEKELSELDLDQPPALVAVNSKGVERSELTGIQLIFANDVKSSFIDAKHPYVKETQKFEVEQNVKFTKIVARVFSGCCITKLELQQEDGGSQIIYDDHNSPYDYKIVAQEIPANHSIIGVQGRIEEEYICSLGFLVATNEPLIKSN